VCLASFVPAFAVDDGSEPPDNFTILKEELALIRDSYLVNLNETIEASLGENTEDLTPWFHLRDEGKAATWADLSYEVPKSLQHLKVTEIPYGLHIQGKVGQYSGDVKITVVTRDMDIFYDRVFMKGTSADFKNLVMELFRNDRVVYYDNSNALQDGCRDLHPRIQAGHPGASRRRKSKNSRPMGQYPI
jgi:hypothetical protein